jgi:four helix bundle protein
MLPEHACRHERLTCYQHLVLVARWFRNCQPTSGDGSLYDQGRRASQSAVLNLAEGCYRQGKARRYHFRVAQGSAAEMVAVLDLVSEPDASLYQAKLREAVAMIGGLR